MPYDIRRDGPEEKPWCLYLQRTGRRLGCTTSHERAQAMIANIEAQKRGDEPMTVDQRIEWLKENDQLLKSPESFYAEKLSVKSIEEPKKPEEASAKDQIEKEPSKDTSTEEVYLDRNQAVLLAMTLADRLGHSVGVKDSKDPNWPVIYIDLGSTYKQVSWHVPRSLIEGFRLKEFFGEWDGHSPLEKRRRIHLFLGGSPDVSFGEAVSSGEEIKSDGEGDDQTQDDQEKEGLEISSRDGQEEAEESVEEIGAELLVSYLPGIVLGDSTENVSKLFELEKARHSIERCMWCSEPPTKAFLWAEGMALAWFCDKHATDWAKENKSEIVASHPLVEGEDPRKWARKRIDEHYHGSKKEVPGDDVCPQADRKGGGLMDKFKQWWASIGEQVLEKAQEETYNCECIKCGHKEESTEHCQDIKCSECGGEMRRAERPGPGKSKAVWSTAYKNNLPDSAFFYIESGGKKNGEGKTTPRSLRHLPYKDAEGKVDIPHVRNALSRASGTKDKDGKFLAESIVSSIQSRARKLLASAQGKFFTLKQADGRFRWFAVSSTAFLDRDVEIISQEALRKAVERKSSGDLGPLRFWHVPGAEFGTCDYRFLEDLCLIESGLWNDDPVATKVRRKVESDPDFFALSIGFIPNLENIETGIKVNGKEISIVWNDIEILERSLLRADRASNRFTLIGTQGGPGMDMKDEQIATLKEMIGDEDLFTQFMGRVQAINAKATEPDAVFKGSTEADQDPLVVFLNKIKEGNSEAAVELEKAVKTLQAPEDPATTPAEVTANAVIQLMKAERLLTDEKLKEELGAILVKIVTEEVKMEDKQETEEKQDETPGDVSAILKTLSGQLTTITTRLTALEKEEGPRAAAFRASEGGDDAEQKDADDQDVGVPRVVQEISAVLTSRLGGL